MSPEKVSEPRTQVLFIGGWGRSGSTLLDRILGQVPGVVSVGELRDIWQRGPVENRLCGCNSPFRDCPFWHEVGVRAFGPDGWATHDAEALARLRYRLDRPWHLPLLIRPGLWPAYERRLRHYTGLLDRVYHAIASTAGSRIVVDSSKIPTYALLLRHLESVELTLVHLVRDSRGVLFSWQKQVRRSDAAEPDEMRRYGLVGSAVRYLLYNQLTQWLAGLGIPYQRIRYEDLVRRPCETVRAVLAHANVADVDPTHVRDGQVDLDVSHSVDGNPMRLAHGPVTLRVDDAWRRHLPARQRRLIAALTSPLLHRYGYLRERPD